MANKRVHYRQPCIFPFHIGLRALILTKTVYALWVMLKKCVVDVGVNVYLGLCACWLKEAAIFRFFLACGREYGAGFAGPDQRCILYVIAMELEPGYGSPVIRSTVLTRWCPSRGQSNSQSITDIHRINSSMTVYEYVQKSSWYSAVG